MAELGANTSLQILDSIFWFAQLQALPLPPWARGMWVTGCHPSAPEGFTSDSTLTMPFFWDRKGKFCLLLSSTGSTEGSAGAARGAWRRLAHNYSVIRYFPLLFFSQFVQVEEDYAKPPCLCCFLQDPVPGLRLVTHSSWHRDYWEFCQSPEDSDSGVVNFTLG